MVGTALLSSCWGLCHLLCAPWPLTALHCLVLRYPLIIDPSGQATEFIMNEYKDRKITRTSFLDDAFRKNLESALRFGNPLLVQVGLLSGRCFLPGFPNTVVK